MDNCTLNGNINDIGDVDGNGRRLTAGLGDKMLHSSFRLFLSASSWLVILLDTKTSRCSAGAYILMEPNNSYFFL